MDVHNLTPLPVHLERNAEHDDRVTVIVLAAWTCRIDDGALVTTYAQRPIETDPALEHPHDAMWLKDRAASVCVHGYVYAPNGEGTEALASVVVDEQRVDVLAVGSRVWQRGVGGGVVPGPARPFDRVPMRWSEAFGGVVQRPWSTTKVDGESVLVPGHEAHFPYNPDGKGWQLDERDAIGKPLPRLEDPRHRITGLDDHPEPRCLAPYPLHGGMRAELLLEDDRVTVRKHDIPRLPSKAAPNLTFEALPDGTTVSVMGMRPQGETLELVTPPAPVTVDVAIGPDTTTLTPSLDAVDIDAEAAEVRLLYRARFTYDLIRREERRITIRSSASLSPPDARLS